MNTNDRPTFEDLLDRIKDGGDENWDYFDANIDPCLTDHTCFERAKAMALGEEQNEHFRDAAATVLARSDFEITPADQAKLVTKMQTERNPFARYWLANCLYKRGNRHQDVVTTWKEACGEKNIPAGEFARDLLIP